MVDHSRRYRIHLEISHLVCAYNHRTVLLTEGIHDLLQGIRSAVHVVTVQLDGKLSALFMVHCKVPASSDTKVVFCRNYVYQVVVLGREFCQQIRSTICRVVINDNDVIWEITLLAEGTFYGVLDSPDSVVNRNYY